MARQTFDRSSLSGGVPALKAKDHRDPQTVEFSVEHFPPFLELVQFFPVFRLLKALCQVRGDDPVTAYYTPLGTDGKPAVFLKAKPKTDPEKCTKCGICATVCPMGSIPKDAPDTCTGICIKCQACILGCPRGAKFFDDEQFLSHAHMLEQKFAGIHKENEFYL